MSEASSGLGKGIMEAFPGHVLSEHKSNGTHTYLKIVFLSLMNT